jgi:hypothetical protein
MRIPPSFWQGIAAMAAAALVLGLVSACKPNVQPSAPPKPAAVKTIAAPATNQNTPQNLSVFVELMPPKGRDPFFPASHRRDPVPPPQAMQDNNSPPPPAVVLILKGIVGSSNHRRALIAGGKNTVDLETGESATVHVPNGQVRVKCLEIGEDHAVIQVEGETEQKRLELNKKGL